jgi:hypothetical protein
MFSCAASNTMTTFSCAASNTTTVFRCSASHNMTTYSCSASNTTTAFSCAAINTITLLKKCQSISTLVRFLCHSVFACFIVWNLIINRVTILNYYCNKSYQHVTQLLVTANSHHQPTSVFYVIFLPQDITFRAIHTLQHTAFKPLVPNITDC